MLHDAETVPGAERWACINPSLEGCPCGGPRIAPGQGATIPDECLAASLTPYGYGALETAQAYARVRGARAITPVDLLIGIMLDGVALEALLLPRYGLSIEEVKDCVSRAPSGRQAFLVWSALDEEAADALIQASHIAIELGCGRVQAIHEVMALSTVAPICDLFAAHGITGARMQADSVEVLARVRALRATKKAFVTLDELSREIDDVVAGGERRQDAR